MTNNDSHGRGYHNISEVSMSREDRLRRHLLAGFLLITAIALIYIVLHRTGTISLFMDSEKLRAVMGRAGALGPLVIIGFFMVAVVINPLPSAPIAVKVALERLRINKAGRDPDGPSP